jgi:hypothetical protein
MNETTNNGGNKVNDQFVPCDTQTLIQQIGIRNILAISGGRVGKRETGVTLPVGHGYSVTIDLHASDTYVVRRVFKRGGRYIVKGELDNVYCDVLGEVAYQASCYASYDFPSSNLTEALSQLA